MNVFIRRYQDTYHWFENSQAQELHQYQGTLEDLAAYYQQHPQANSWVLIAPALDTAERSFSFTHRERRHIAKAVPFLLEDDLLSEASELHYVADKPAAEHIDVVALDSDALAAWLGELAAAGIRPTHCLPEVKLLLQGDNSDWQLFYRENEFILRAGNGQCTACEQQHFPLMLELLTEQFSRLPRQIELIADDESALEQALAVIPEPVKALVEPKTLPYGAMIQDAFQRQAKVWNLLKGPFAYTQQWLAMLLPWRWVAVSLVAVFVLQASMTFVEYRQLVAENARLRAETEAVFRTAIPKGQLVDARRQLQVELDKLQSGGGAAGFMGKMQIIGGVFARHEVQGFNSVTWEREKNEIRIDVLVSNYDKLQEIINGLQQAGLTSEIQNSNAQGEQLRARIRITG